MTNKDGTKLFLKDEAVFKITKTLPTCEVYDHGMVTTKSDYEKKLADHQHASILNVASLTYKLAYIYGCLEKGRTEIFTFYFRRVGRRDWVEWFVINPD